MDFDVPSALSITWPSKALFCLVLSVLLIWVLKSALNQDRLSNIPGPRLARYTDLWGVYQALILRTDKQKLEWLQRLKKKYGDVVRVGPRSVFVLDPTAVPVIYGLRSRLNKGGAYIPFRQSGVTTSLLSIPDEKTHSQYRKLVSGAYSMSSLKGYEPYIDEMIGRFVAACDAAAQSQTPMDIGVWSVYYCYDVVSKVTMGIPLGFLDGVDVFGLCRRVEGIASYASVVGRAPWLHKVFQENPLMRTTKPSPFLSLVRTKVQERMNSFKSSSEERPDLLSHFVATSQAYPETMDQRQIAIFTSGNLIAGALSPGKTFKTLLDFLVSHADAQERLCAEVDRANCADPATFDEVKALPYLEGVVKEALRLHVSSSFDLQRVTGPNGLLLPNGVALPGDINVGCPAASINRDDRVFGDDAHLFNPERWIEGKSETEEDFRQRRTLMERIDLSFGQGSRACVGKSIFMLEVHKAVATLFRHFKLEQIRDNSSPGIWVKVHPREEKAPKLVAS